ncbi:hypothetical protein ACQKL0_20075 [Peribacillus sp. NPDC097264]|uniref:hypothetical protein n=1 Tax=Peribacillus sp. NPDC097264 TaxID=3390616 RepID=UPI003CFEF511
MKETPKKLYHLNAKLPIEYKEMVEQITEYYRSKIEIGRVSQGDVIQDLIKKKYEEIGDFKKI